MSKSFRPLTGILFFNGIEYNVSEVKKTVSVPLRGFCFLIHGGADGTLEKGRFPSPYGDFVF